MNPMKLWTMTDVGLVRKDNQDAFATRQLESGCTICVAVSYTHLTLPTILLV